MTAFVAICDLQQVPGSKGIIGVPHMGVSENSVPLNPLVNDHYPY